MTKFKISILLFCISQWLFLTTASANYQNSQVDLSAPTFSDTFKNPPDWTKPWCYWFWVDGDVSADGIAKDLERMAAVGIQSAIVMNVHNDTATTTGPLKMLSDEWHVLTKYAFDLASQHGIEMHMFNCPGWSMAGGPWIQPHQAMRYVDWKEYYTSGGAYSAKVRPDGKFYQDVAVLAVPVKSSVNLTIPLQVGDNEFTNSSPFVARSLAFTPNLEQYTLKAHLYSVSETGEETLVSYIHEVETGLNNFTNFLPLGYEIYSFESEQSSKFILRVHEMTGISPQISISSEARVAQATEKQLGRMYTGPVPPWETYIFPDTVEPSDQAAVYKLDDVINLTDQLDANGNLNCVLPEGQWSIIYFGMTPTGKTNTPAAEEATGLEIDKMSKTHQRHHFNSMYGRLLSELEPHERAMFKGLTLDSYEVGAQNWTDGFDATFTDRVGYNPIKYLPVFTGRVVGSAAESDQFLWDLRRLVADLIAENFVGGTRELANEHGMTLWVENYGHYGYPAEFLQYGGYSDYVAGEFWTNPPQWLGPVECRGASSSAHIYGKNRIYAEAYTSTLIRTDHPYTFKATGDEMFSYGINHFVLTVSKHQPRDGFPGLDRGYGTSFHRNTPWYNKMQAFVKYLQRSHLMLQQGNPAADVAVYIGDFAPQMDGPPNPVPEGYAYDYINSDVIMNRLQVLNGDLVVHDENDPTRVAATYKFLSLPTVKYLRPQVQAAIDILIAQGAKVVNLAEVANTLNSEGIRPIVKNNSSAFRWTHRKTPSEDIFFISNFAETGLFTANYRTNYTVAEVLNPVSGEVKRVHGIRKAEGGSELTVNVENTSDSLFLIFKNGEKLPDVSSVMRNDQGISIDSIDITYNESGDLIVDTKQPGYYDIGFSNGLEKSFVVTDPLQPLTIYGPWQINFGTDNSNATQAFSVNTNELLSWDTLPSSEAQIFNGTAVYQKIFIPTADLLTENKRVYLNLGQVNVMAKVTLNGVTYDTLWMPPFELDVTDSIRAGENSLLVEVTSRSPAVSPGLLGPVVLRPEQRSTYSNLSINLLSDGFETPALGNGNFQYNPTGSSWTFNGGGIGANASPINVTNPPEGVQAAFIQGNSSFEQLVNVANSGLHRIRFYSAQRLSNQQRVALLLDGNNILEAQAQSAAWEVFEVETNLTAGNHTIRFEGLNPLGGDNTAFIDRVEIDYEGVTVSASVIDTDGDGLVDVLDADDDGDGSLDTFELANGRDPLDVNDLEFAFDSLDAENWQAINHISSLSVTGAGELQLQVNAGNNDPFIVKNDFNFSGDIIRSLYLRYRSDSVISAVWPVLYWATAGNNNFDAARLATPTSQTADGSWTVASYDLSAHPEWAGNMISQLRIDINETTTAAESTWIDLITATNIIPDRYTTWKADNGVTDDYGDDDGDGITNFLEFALGGDPNSSDGEKLPTVSRSGSDFEFKFKRQEADVSYIMQKSTDLLNWTDYVTVNDSHGVVGADVMITIPDTEMLNGKLFLRMEASN